MAVSVTSTIKTILAGQKRNEALGAERVRGLLEAVQKQVIAELAGLPADSYAAHHLRQSLSAIEAQLSTWERDVQSALSGLLADSWKSGEGLLPAAAAAAEIQLGTLWLSTSILDALKEFTFGRIAAVRSDAYNRIKGEVTMGILGQKTPQEVAGAIAGNLERPGVFKTIAERAEVITGTEMGRAFSLATEKSIAQAQATVPELRRMWLHAGHPRMPRQIHLAMHGQIRDVGKPFYQTPAGVPVFFPRDPNAPIKEIIRCGCTHVPYHPDWGDEKSFAADFDTRQLNLWKGKKGGNHG